MFYSFGKNSIQYKWFDNQTNRNKLFFLIVLAFFNVLNLYCQQVDSTLLNTFFTEIYQSEIISDQTMSEENDFSPAVAVAAIFVFGFILFFIGIGVAFAFLILFLFSVLIGAGILSSSILVGIGSKSFEKGLRFLSISGCTISGILLGTLGFIFFSEVYDWWPLRTSAFVGILFGLFSGLSLGFLLNYTFRQVSDKLIKINDIDRNKN